MMRGWWKISRPEHLTEITDALHQRGIREGELKRNLVKHLEASLEASVSVSFLHLAPKLFCFVHYSFIYFLYFTLVLLFRRVLHQMI